MIIRFVFRLLTGVLFLPAIASAAEPERLPVPVSWFGQLGALHVTTSATNGLFSGVYDSASFNCPGPFDAAGHIAFDRVVFSVNFRRCGTFVTWNGVMRGPALVTHWTMIFTDPVTGRRHFQRGRDTLVRAP